jgi:putative RNA 2'-phosphotransferase
MKEKDIKNSSKFLSLILRHSPETIGLNLDTNGWAMVDELLLKMAKQKHVLSKEALIEIVETNDKKRFVFSEDGSKIRANQGHSIDIDLNLTSQIPPEILYHGTVSKYLDSIKLEGLKKMNRQHVHLSKDLETAIKVGSRRGEAIILTIDTSTMLNNGLIFYLSDNGVWLTDHVPAQYIDFNGRQYNG